MGGEDWRDWIEALSAADVLEKDAVTVAYSYIGPEITHPDICGRFDRSGKGASVPHSTGDE